MHDLAAAQKNAGHEVFVISGSMEPRSEVGCESDPAGEFTVERIHRSDLYFDSWDKGYCPEVGSVLRDRLEELRPDVLHLHHWIRLTSDIVNLAQELGIPVVLTLHDLATSCPRGFRVDFEGEICTRRLDPDNCVPCVPRRPWQDDDSISECVRDFRGSFRSEVGRASAVLCATQLVRDIVADSLDLDPGAFTLLPLAYESRFESRPLVPGDGPFRFAYWGSITERKGVEMLVDAFCGLADQRDPGARPVALEIFGQCDLPRRQQDLEQQVEGHPITLHGAFEYTQLAGAEISAAVFPSLCMETYGLVLDEAFELGLPVVVPDVGALPERAGEAGLVFGTGNVDDLRSKMELLVDDEELRGQLLARIPENPPVLATHMETILAVYEQVIREPGPIQEGVEAVSSEQRAIHAFRQQELQFRSLINHEGEGDA